MNILFTVEYFYPKIGGAEKVVQHISTGLSKRGHKLTIATTRLENRNCRTLDGIRIEEFDIQGNFVKGIREGKKGEIKRYKELLLNGGYDLICQYALQTWHTDLAFEILDSIKSKKVIFPVGLSALTSVVRRILYYNWLKKLPIYLRKYDLVIYHCSNYIDKQFGDKHGISNFVVVPNGVDLEEFNIRGPLDFKWKYDIKTKWMLLNVSNHYKIKGHSFLMKAAKFLCDEDVTLVIIGDKALGSRQDCYDKCIKESKRIKNVKLLTGINREDTIKAFMESDIYLLGSQIEYFPLTILEAMAAKKPFISTDVGCCGFLGHPIIVNTPKKMASKVKELLSDSKLREKIGNYNYEDVQQYDWSRIILDYERIFLNLLEK